VLPQYGVHVHAERHQQGQGKGLLVPWVSHTRKRTGPMPCRARLGELLKDDVCEGACVV
jgi:hypothetical protein